MLPGIMANSIAAPHICFPRVEYLYFPKPVERNIAVELQAMWLEHLGVSVDLVKQEWKIYLASMKDKNYHLCRSS